MRPVIDHQTALTTSVEEFADFPFPVNMAFGPPSRPSTRKGLVINSNDAMNHIMNKVGVLRELQADGIDVPDFMPLEGLFANENFSYPRLQEFAGEDDVMVRHLTGSALLPANEPAEVMRMMRQLKSERSGSVLRMPEEYSLVSVTGAPKIAGKRLQINDVDFHHNGILRIDGDLNETVDSDEEAEKVQQFLEQKTLEVLDMMGLDYGTVDYTISSQGRFVIDVSPRLIKETIPGINDLVNYLLKKKHGK